VDALGRWLVVLGGVLAVAGLLLLGASHLGLPLGRLPGDLRIERGGVRFFFPITTCLLLSLLLSGLLWLIGRIR